MSPHLCQQIINGEYVDCCVWLNNCSYDDARQASSSLTPLIKFSSLAARMEEWNIYAMVLLREYPARALELLAYQSIICSASKSLPLHAWLKYDRKFRALAAANSSMRWDQWHSYYWLEAISAMPLSQTAQHWPCPYCKATVHFPENFLRLPFRVSHQPPQQPSHRPPICGDFNRGNCIRHACRYQHICTLCKGNHPVSACPQRKRNRGLQSSL